MVGNKELMQNDDLMFEDENEEQGLVAVTDNDGEDEAVFFDEEEQQNSESEPQNSVDEDDENLFDDENENQEDDSPVTITDDMEIPENESELENDYNESMQDNMEEVMDSEESESNNESESISQTEQELENDYNQAMDEQLENSEDESEIKKFIDDDEEDLPEDSTEQNDDADYNEECKKKSNEAQEQFNQNISLLEKFNDIYSNQDKNKENYTKSISEYTGEFLNIIKNSVDININRIKAEISSITKTIKTNKTVHRNLSKIEKLIKEKFNQDASIDEFKEIYANLELINKIKNNLEIEFKQKANEIEKLKYFITLYDIINEK